MPAALPPTQLVIYAPLRLRREAWRAVLSSQPGVAVVEASQAGDVPSTVRSGSPVTVLIDGDVSYLDTARQLRAALPDAGLLFLVPHYDPTEVVSLLRAGASGCVSMEDSVGDVVRAVIAVGRGEIVLPPAIASRALATLARGEPPVQPAGPRELVEPLSERETEVLRLLAQGMTNKDIAQTLMLSVRTVEAHLRTVYGKLAVRSRTEAALWAVKHGYGLETE